MESRAADTLPEVTLLRDARGPRPENAVGVGDLWYEPGIWQLPVPPAEKVLYWGLCSHMGHGQINRKDLRAILKDSPDDAIAAALEGLVRRGLLAPLPSGAHPGSLPGYEVRPLDAFSG
jgi:hypothetical protein